MSAAQEIERKFLVEGDVPVDLDEEPCEVITQGYVSIDPNGTEVRLRVTGKRCILGVKSGPSRARVEEEIELGWPSFEALWPLTEGRRLQKRRYAINDRERVIELDVYDGALEGLITAEVEFPSEGEADAFRPPTWLGTEVTGDTRYSNQSLAVRAHP